MGALAKFKAKPTVSQKRKSNDDNVIMVDGQRWTPSEIQALAKAGVLSTKYKNDPASTTLSAPALQGPFQGNSNQYGIFSSPGVRPERFSTIMRPLSIARMLIGDGALMRSEYVNEILEVMTGVTAFSGTNATGFCGNPPTAGQAKVSQQVYQFGSWSMKTNLNAIPLIGQLRNRADVPGRILNAGPESNPLIPDIMYQLTDTRSQLQYELFLLGVELERSLEKVLIGGNSSLASTSTNSGWIQEFNGLDAQIKTGYTDFPTGKLSPALDSIVENWGNQLVGGTQTSTGRNIVQLIADTYFGLLQKAAKVGMEGFEMAIVMRSEFFRALTDVYACSYATARCVNTNAGQPQMVDQQVVNDLRLEMLNGQYLLIEGVKVPVVFSSGMAFNQVAATQYVTGFYFVPINWAGRPLIRLEYFPMDNQYANEYASFLNAERYRVLNNGLFLVGYRSNGLCDEYIFASKMRMILETPFLAARVDNINFSYVVQSGSAYPGETSLYANGGVTYRTPFYGSL